MEALPHRHLTTLTLTVDFAGVQGIGAIRAGVRGVAAVAGGRFEGTRLCGRVIGGHDWFVRRADATLAIDVRLTLETDAGAIVYLRYEGHMLGAPDAMARFRRGELLAAEDYRLEVVGRFECGAPGLEWLNDVIAVGVGRQTATGPVYSFFEIGRDPTPAV